MTPEQKLARTKKLVSAAKALLSLQVVLAVGAQRIMNCLYLLGPEFEDNHKVFGKFIKTIPPDIPVGNARLLWSYDPMLKTDKDLAEVENKFRESLLRTCSKSPEQQCQERKVNELQAGVEQALAVLP